MQLLNSKNYDVVYVLLRGSDKPLTMNATNGVKLMRYLTAENKSTHVGLTDTEGNNIIVRTTDILRVEPSVRAKELHEYA